MIEEITEEHPLYSVEWLKKGGGRVGGGEFPLKKIFFLEKRSLKTK